MKITGSRLTRELVKDLHQKGRLISVPNIYVFKWESDVYTVSKSHFVSEYEIKVSRSDFFADFNKVEKHKSIEDLYTKDIRNIDFPNHFYYVCPEGLIEKEDVPEYAGLIIFNQYGHFIEKKKAPKLHGEKMNPGMWEVLAMKFYYKTL